MFNSKIKRDGKTVNEKKKKTTRTWKKNKKKIDISENETFESFVETRLK